MTPVSNYEAALQLGLHYLGILLLLVVPPLTSYWCYQLFQNGRKKGYLFLLAFALTPWLTFALNEVSYRIHREEIERLNAQRTDGIITVTRSTILPIYYLIFAAGVLRLRNESKNEK